MAHMHYKGTGKVHSFRGLLVDGGQDKIRIQGPVGAIAWRITKFEVFPSVPGGTSQQSTVKIYRESQGAPGGSVDFTDNEMLAAAYLGINDGAYYGTAYVIVFDNALFSRNIFVNLFNDLGTPSCNYYIELEEVKVSAAGMAQLAVAAARRTIG